MAETQTERTGGLELCDDLRTLSRRTWAAVAVVPAAGGPRADASLPTSR